MGFDSVADGDKSGSTIGRTILVLATFTLLAGTSMASGLEDFASQEYAEEDWREGVVDDATDDAPGAAHVITAHAGASFRTTTSTNPAAANSPSSSSTVKKR